MGGVGERDDPDGGATAVKVETVYERDPQRNRGEKAPILIKVTVPADGKTGLLSRKLPDWAPEIGCASWAQILLKFVLANPAVTCVIPGTGKPQHMRDNVQAGFGTYPNAAMLKRMIAEAGV